MDLGDEQPAQRRMTIRLVVAFFAFIIAGTMIATQFPD